MPDPMRPQPMTPTFVMVMILEGGAYFRTRPGSGSS